MRTVTTPTILATDTASRPTGGKRSCNANDNCRWRRLPHTNSLRRSADGRIAVATSVGIISVRDWIREPSLRAQLSVRCRQWRKSSLPPS
jgi:hypothetical protein